jgi:hypothetical protein
MRYKCFINASAGRLAVLFLFLGIASVCRAQCVDSSQVNGFLVRKLRVETWLGLIPADLSAQLVAHHGEPYNAQRASFYQSEVAKYLAGNENQQANESLLAHESKLVASGRLIYLQCVQRVDEQLCAKSFSADHGHAATQCVDVVLKAYSVDINILNSSPYLVLLPRSALSTFYAAIPRPILRLNPRLTSEADKAFGYGLGFNTTTDLLALGGGHATPKAQGGRAEIGPMDKTISRDDELEIVDTSHSSRISAVPKLAGEVPATQLLLGTQGLKSFNKSYYQGDVSLQLSYTRPARFLQRLSFGGKFEGNQRPQGGASYRQNVFEMDTGAHLATKSSLLQLIQLSGSYNRSHNHLTPEIDFRSESTVEDSIGLKVATDGMLKKGLLRSAFTFDRASVDGLTAYRRATILGGYGKEIPVANKKHYQRKINVDGHECIASYDVDPLKADQTFGLEMIVGAGRAWGTVPEYARFFGGNQFTNFLYDDMPDRPGPLLRGFGMGQAGVLVAGGVQRGGTSYWHTNASLSIPIPAWSQPVIPHDWVTSTVVSSDEVEPVKAGVPLGDRVCVDLRQVLKNSVSKSGTQLLIAQLAREKLTDDEKKILRHEGRTDLTTEQESELKTVQERYQANKESVRPEVTELFQEEITPVTDFIADHANFFAVKPLVMFDAARIAAPNALDNHTRLGVGGGLQLDIVMVRFELGYVAALNRVPGDRRGNIVGRLIMKRFF